MNDGSLIKTLSLPSTHPWASERFHCFRRTPSQREYKCKSKCLDAIEGPLFIESIIICRRRGRETKNYYRELIYTRLFTCCYKEECVHRDPRTSLLTQCDAERCVRTQYCFLFCRKYRLSLTLIQPLSRCCWLVLGV